MAIQLRQQDLKRIEQHGAQAYPNECCGALLGREQDGCRVVTDILGLNNSREGTSDVPKGSPEIMDLLRNAYQLLQVIKNKDRITRDWLERADLVLNSARNRFRILPEDFLRSDREAARRGVNLLGFYHSHPDHPARPSQYDREHLLCPWYTTYLILSVQNGAAGELTGWTLSDDHLDFKWDEISVLGNTEAENDKGAS